VPLVLRNGLVDLGGGDFGRADVAVDGGRIIAVGDTAAGDGESLDCTRFAVVPGMVNAHNHSNENWLRGRFDNLPLEPWMLFSYPPLAAPAQTPREVYVRTLLGAIEMIRSGATTVVDFLYELPAFTDESLEAVVKAYRDAGLRALVVLGMGDRAYYETVVLDLGLVPADIRAQIEAEQPPSWPEWEALARRAVERYHRPDEGIAIGLGPSGPQRCTDELLVGCAALADELDLAIHIHVLETRMQALSSRRRYGRTLPAHMQAIGFLGPRVNFEHAVWLTPEDFTLMADANVTAVHNPVSNMKLGSGISPVPLLLRAGINVALGTDGMSSNDGNDMYATLKIAGLVHKLWEIDYAEWLGAREAWRAATESGARAAGDAGGLGRIEPGRRADLVLLDLESRVFTPLNDTLNHVVFSSTTTAVDSVLIGGRWVLRNGRLTGVDEESILAEARELGAGVIARHDEAFELGRRLLEPLHAGWREALAADVGARRSVPL
jgi:5-methylthioadenosine/S-adenosylhomocysteine deaminase